MSGIAFGRIREPLPVEIIVNDRPRQTPHDTTVAELLEQLDLGSKFVAVEVNLKLVPRPQHAGHRLADGDKIEIVTLVGGG